MSNERWLPVPDYPGYAVSDHGRVRSLDRESQSRWGTPMITEGRILKQVMIGNNERKYRGCTLYRNGVAKQFLTHVLVLMAFRGERPKGLQGCHRDDDHENNRLSNLYWGTPAQNGRDAVNNGLNWKSNITECPQGHEYTEANTYRAPRTGHRQCRTCQKAKNKGNANADRTECPQGHQYNESNTIHVGGKRQCRECGRTRAREYQRRKRAARR